MEREIYLDNAATTRVDDDAAKLFRRHLRLDQKLGQRLPRCARVDEKSAGVRHRAKPAAAERTLKAPEGRSEARYAVCAGSLTAR